MKFYTKLLIGFIAIGCADHINKQAPQNACLKFWIKKPKEETKSLRMEFLHDSLSQKLNETHMLIEGHYPNFPKGITQSIVYDFGIFSNEEVETITEDITDLFFRDDEMKEVIFPIDLKRNSYSLPILHFAAFHGNIEFMRLILQHTALYINTYYTASPFTLLSATILGKNEKILWLLMKHQFKVNPLLLIKDCFGATPLSLSKKFKLHKIKTYIQQNAADLPPNTKLPRKESAAVYQQYHDETQFRKRLVDVGFL